MSTLYEAAQALKSAIENGTVEDEDFDKYCDAIGAKQEIVDDMLATGAGPSLVLYLDACAVLTGAKTNR